MRRFISLPVAAVAAISAATIASAKAPIEEARDVFFTRLVKLEQTFDPKVADDAVIKSIRRYPGGFSKATTMPAPAYKKLLRSVMPVAKSRGDYSTYSQMVYKDLGEGRVKLQTVRYSVLKKYSSPYTLIMASKPNGNWLIVEETSESRP